MNNVSGDDLILLHGLFGDEFELRLIERDGAVLNRWPVSFMTFMGNLEAPADLADTPWRARPETDWNISYQGVGVYPDGSVLYNVAHQGLVRLDRCGVPIWIRQGNFHHSIEPAEGGG